MDKRHRKSFLVVLFIKSWVCKGAAETLDELVRPHPKQAHMAYWKVSSYNATTRANRRKEMALCYISITEKPSVIATNVFNVLHNCSLSQNFSKSQIFQVFASKTCSQVHTIIPVTNILVTLFMSKTHTRTQPCTNPMGTGVYLLCYTTKQIVYIIH